VEHDRHGWRYYAAAVESTAVLGEVLTAIVTPFRADGSVDYEAFQELAEHLVEHGSDGFVVCGTTGEAPTLTDDERIELVRSAIDTVGDRATVIAGTGTYSTAHSVHLTRKAHEVGADGFLVVAPYYNKPPPRGIVAHFKTIAAETDRPIVAYNIPSRVVINIEPETMTELAEIPNVTAVKETIPKQAARDVELGLDLYAGDDALMLPFLELGGTGGICVYTHVVGTQVKQMVRRYRAGDHAAAAQINGELAPALDLLNVAVNPLAIKAALRLLGHDVGGHRLPLVEATEDEVAQVRVCLERLGVLQGAAA
jgi:4-hydroxy-tetrahydrodipicolinate synthase